jgi:hypothetical protein
LIEDALEDDEDFSANYYASRAMGSRKVYIKKKRASNADITEIETDDNGYLPTTTSGQTHQVTMPAPKNSIATPDFLPAGVPTECFVQSTDPGSEPFDSVVAVDLLEEIQVLEWQVLAPDLLRFVAMPEPGTPDSDLMGLLLAEDGNGQLVHIAAFDMAVGGGTTPAETTTWGKIKALYAN